MTDRDWTLVLIAWWIALVGVWPLADPGHNLGDGWLVPLDLTLHAWGIWYLVTRYRIVRRPSPDSQGAP